MSYIAPNYPVHHCQRTPPQRSLIVGGIALLGNLALTVGRIALALFDACFGFCFRRPYYPPTYVYQPVYTVVPAMRRHTINVVPTPTPIYTAQPPSQWGFTRVPGQHPTHPHAHMGRAQINRTY